MSGGRYPRSFSFIWRRGEIAYARSQIAVGRHYLDLDGAGLVRHIDEVDEDVALGQPGTGALGPLDDRDTVTWGKQIIKTDVVQILLAAEAVEVEVVEANRVAGSGVAHVLGDEGEGWALYRLGDA